MTTGTVKWAPATLEASLRDLESFSKDYDDGQADWSAGLADSLLPAIDALRHALYGPTMIMVPDIDDLEIRTIAMCVDLIEQHPAETAARITRYLRVRFEEEA